MMQVNVKVFGEIASTVGAEHTLELTENTSILSLTNTISERAGLRKGYMGEFRVGSDELAIMINGKNVVILDGLDTVLKQGDLVVIMPSIFGG
jgi:molybdopterin converting factor small subunit